MPAARSRAKRRPVAQPAEPPMHVVVPVYNEADNFKPFYESLRTHVRTPYRLVVVYDHDRDTTLPVVRELQKSDPELMLLANEGKGVLGALKTGLAYPKSGAVLVSMADLSDDHTVVDRMFEQFKQGYAVVSASRYCRGGRQIGGPVVKGLLSRAGGVSLKWLGGLPTSDPTNNFKLYSRELLEKVTIESQGGFELALELTVKAHQLGLPIGEVPTTWRDRVAGQSNFKLAKWLPQYLRWYVVGLRHRFGLN